MIKTTDLFDEPRWSRFRVLALSVGVKAATVKKWRQRQSIPGRWHFELLRQAKNDGFALTHAELKGRA